MPTAHPGFGRFHAALSGSALLVPWRGDVVRQTAPRYMSRPYRFTGVGSVRVGGRWTVQHLMPSVYASTDPETLAAEMNHQWQRYGWTTAQFKAQTIVAMHWKLQAVVDLTSAATLKALKLTVRQLVGCDWQAAQFAGAEALTQAVARAAFECAAEGLIVPSARLKGGINVVYFPSNRRDGTLIQTPDEPNIPFLHGL